MVRPSLRSCRVGVGLHVRADREHSHNSARQNSLVAICVNLSGPVSSPSPATACRPKTERIDLDPPIWFDPDPVPEKMDVIITSRTPKDIEISRNFWDMFDVNVHSDSILEYAGLVASEPSHLYFECERLSAQSPRLLDEAASLRALQHTLAQADGQAALQGITL